MYHRKHAVEEAINKLKSAKDTGIEQRLTAIEAALLVVLQRESAEDDAFDAYAPALARSTDL